MKHILVAVLFTITSLTFAQTNSNYVRGFLVLNQDTLYGGFRDFNNTVKNYNDVVFMLDYGKEQRYNSKDIKAVSADGIIYESVNYSFNGAFSGVQTQGYKLMVLLYASPNIRVYSFQQAGEVIYYFADEHKYKRYTPFSRDDAANFVINQNKKLSAIFSECDAVKQKILSGEYELKKENSGGHIKAIADYENNCGSRKHEYYMQLLERENVMKLYR